MYYIACCKLCHTVCTVHGDCFVVVVAVVVVVVFSSSLMFFLHACVRACARAHLCVQNCLLFSFCIYISQLLALLWIVKTHFYIYSVYRHVICMATARNRLYGVTVVGARVCVWALSAMQCTCTPFTHCSKSTENKQYTWHNIHSTDFSQIFSQIVSDQKVTVSLQMRGRKEPAERADQNFYSDLVDHQNRLISCSDPNSSFICGK